MKGRGHAKAIVILVCVLLIVTSFFAKDFVLYDFHMQVSDYTYGRTEERPAQAAADIWFRYGDSGREVFYGTDSGVSQMEIRLYGLSSDTEGMSLAEAERAGVKAVEVEPEELWQGEKQPSEHRSGESRPLRPDFYGSFIAAIPEKQEDTDGDGREETVWDYARADFGPMAFNPVPQPFGIRDIPFEVVFSERKYMLAYYEGELLTEGQVTVASEDGNIHTYPVDEHGRIDGLPIRDIRRGFTASYTPDGENVYRMYYALEDYPYFSAHFWKAHVPLLLTLVLAAAGIILVQMFRNFRERKNPAYAVYGRERAGLYQKNPLRMKTRSPFLLIRWLCLFAGMFFWTYAGRLMGQGQALNEVAVPVFSCPFNLDQVVETPCYYLTHLPALFTRFGPGFPERNLMYAVGFLLSLVLCIVFLGRIFCGFLCPAGLIQDLMDRLREALHIRPIIVSERMNRLLQPVKWVWIILFLGFTFTGKDFCDICPLKGFTTAQGGYWTNLYLGGFFAVILLVGSFFIKRFWCIICPMGYLMGLCHRFNLFRLKKNCTACTECGACYEACPMRLKHIYTEREKEEVQTVDCMMCGECIRHCPEDYALSMTFCGKTVYSASQKTFLSRYEQEEER